MWTAGGPGSSSVFPKVNQRICGIELGWEEASYKATSRAHSNTVITTHPRHALLTCSVYDPKQNPRHPTPPSSSTGQHTYGIFMNVTRRSTARVAWSWWFKSIQRACYSGTGKINDRLPQLKSWTCMTYPTDCLFRLLPLYWQVLATRGRSCNISTGSWSSAGWETRKK